MNAPKFILPKDLEVGDGLLAVIRLQLVYCSFALHPKGDIHNNVQLIRQTVKHIRAYLALIRPRVRRQMSLPDPSYYRSKAHALSEIRDLYIQYKLIKKVCIKLNLFKAPFINQLHNFFQSGIEPELLKVRSVGIFENLSDEFEKQSKLLEISKVPVPSEYALKQMLKTRKKVLTIFKKIRKDSKSEKFHTLRKWAQKLSIQLSLFRSDYPSAPFYLDLKKLNKLILFLGQEHDHHEIMNKLDICLEFQSHENYKNQIRPYLQLKITELRFQILELGNSLF